MRAVQSERRKFLAGFLPPLIVAAVIAGGLLLYYKQYGASSSSYDNAISKCVRDHTFWNQNSTAREEATAACVRDIPESIPDFAMSTGNPARKELRDLWIWHPADLSLQSYGRKKAWLCAEKPVLAGVRLVARASGRCHEAVDNQARVPSPKRHLTYRHYFHNT